MADAKQSYLNGAYYGPPVPPQQAYRSVGRSSGCGPCCLLCTLIKFLVSIIVIIGIIVLVLWLVFRPNEIKVYVEDASLTQFNLANKTNNLQYNLTLDMSIRNPNKKIGIYYDYIEAQALYSDSRFGFQILPTFYQGHKNTSMLYPAFQGSGLLLGDSVTTTYNREKGEGNYYIDVNVYTKLRLKLKVIFSFKIHIKPEIRCTVKLPVPGNGGSTAAFERTGCDVKYF